MGSIYVLVGLASAGMLLKKRFFTEAKAPWFLFLGLGFGAYYFYYLLASLVLPAPWVVYLAYIIFAISIAISISDLRTFKARIERRQLMALGLVLLIFLPYVALVLSPPLGYDGINYYLPSVNWVFHKGLAFNPYLTRYTIMPQGAEYFFALGYPFGEYQGVRFLDLGIALIFILTVYEITKAFIALPWALHVTIGIVLFPKTFSWLVGQAKPDILGLMFFLQLLYFLIRKNYPIAFVFLGLTLILKMTYWGFSPALFLLFIIGDAKRFFILANLKASIIPLLFLAPFLLKNQVQVGNPVPNLTHQSSRFTKEHYVFSVVQKNLEVQETKGYNRYNEIPNLTAKIKKGDFKAIHPIKGIVYLSLAAGWLFFVIKHKQMSQSLYPKLLLAATVLSLLWIQKMGVLWVYDIRFWWSIALLILYLFGLAAQILLQSNKYLTSSKVKYILIGLPLIILTAYTYVSKGKHLRGALEAISLSDYDWYKKRQQDEFCFSLKVKEMVQSESYVPLEIRHNFSSPFRFLPANQWEGFTTDSLAVATMAKLPQNPLPTNYHGYVIGFTQFDFFFGHLKASQCDTLFTEGKFAMLKVDLRD